MKAITPVFFSLYLFSAAICVAVNPSVTVSSFGETKAGEPVHLYSLKNRNGMSADIMTYGATVVRLIAPDRRGQMGDVLLGFNSLSDYEAKSPYFGCIVGRYGNRIAEGKFTLNGQTFTLATNNDTAHLHGGDVGFDKKVWKAEPVLNGMNAGVRFHYLSIDGEEGYPGNLEVTVTYYLTDNNELEIQYFATTDQATPVNLTNHMYFNLQGEGIGDINGHFLMIDADRFTPVDEALIPTGELAPVLGTPFDFTSSRAIGERVNSDHEQINLGGGYDHNFVLNKPYGTMGMAAEVYEPVSGRVMQVFTEEPGIQFYGGNFLETDGVVRVGKSGVAYLHRTGFCLETQHFPDSPNQPSFPETILNPGETYETTTVYRFGSR